MGDYKSGYSTASSKTKGIASHNSGLKKAQSKAEARSHAYRENWKKVNLNDVVGKLASGEKPYLDGNKLSYHKFGSDIKIITDPFGGYLRFFSISKNDYVTIDGKTRKDFSNSAEFQKHSHYYILKREEM